MPRCAIILRKPHFGLDSASPFTFNGEVKSLSLFLSLGTLLALASCGPCNCNSYNKDYLDDIKPTSSKSF